MTMRLKDKVALITGAGSGMGRATATLFAREGAKVAVVDINAAGAEDTVRRITSSGGQAIAIRADVSNSEDASSMVSGAVAKFGGLDIIYNKLRRVQRVARRTRANRIGDRDRAADSRVQVLGGTPRDQDACSPGRQCAFEQRRAP